MQDTVGAWTVAEDETDGDAIGGLHGVPGDRVGLACGDWGLGVWCEEGTIGRWLHWLGECLCDGSEACGGNDGLHLGCGDGVLGDWNPLRDCASGSESDR